MHFLNINLLIISILFFCICPSFAQKSNLTIAGSTTIMPISEKWAKAFKNKTGVIVNVHGGGSTSGIKATKIGTADIGASSRELTNSEKINLKEIVIGRDVLVVIVNKKNPISSLSTDQIRSIFSGRIKNWKDVGGEDKPIQIINRESGSGTRELFTDIIMQIVLKDKTKKIVPMSLNAIVNNSNAEIKESVKLIPNSIGYISIGYADNTIKELSINLISPTPQNINTGKYLLVRNLYYLFREDNDKSVERFISFILSNEGQSFVKKEGFLSIIKNNARN